MEEDNWGGDKLNDGCLDIIIAVIALCVIWILLLIYDN